MLNEWAAAVKGVYERLDLQELDREFNAEELDEGRKSATVSAESNEKSRETRTGRMAERQGLQLKKYRGRNPNDYLCGTYELVDPSANCLAYSAGAYGRGFGLTLDDVERYLTENEAG